MITRDRRELRKLPDGWVWTTLGEVAEIVLGQSPPSSTYNEDGIGLPFYQGKAEFGDIYPAPRKWCTAPKKTAEKGDVLISVRAPVGPTNICPEKSCIGRGLAAIRGSGGMQPLFVLYLLRSLESVVAGKGTGTTFKAITGNQLRGLAIPLPPLAEQQRIVAKIEELFTQLEAGVATLESGRAQLQRYRQAVLKAAVEGELTREWREARKGELEPASALLERVKEERIRAGKKPRESLPIDITDLPRLPNSWAWVRLGEICETTSGGTPSRKEASYFGGDIPWLRSGELENRLITRAEESITDKGLSNSSARVIPNGTLLIALYGATAGKLGILGIDAAINQAICAIFTPRGLSREYLFWFLLHHRDELLRARVGGAQPNMSQRILREVRIPLPPLAEQTGIVEEIERRLSVADKADRATEQSSKRAERLRQSVLKRAFEGKLVGQDLADEPATVLLARLKTSRQRLTEERKTTRATERRRRAEARKRRETSISKSTQLRELLHQLQQESGGSVLASELLEASGVGMDAFHDLLRKEIRAGRITERREGDVVFLETRE